jgi:phosphoribosylanthranilate isomerase
MPTLIKICGLTREVDVDDAVRAGASHVGFVGYAASPRFTTAHRAAALAARLPASVTPVRLLVNVSAAEFEAELAALGQVMPRLVWQFHGDETAAACAAMAGSTGRPYWRAARVAPGFDLLKFCADSRQETPPVQAVLLDKHVEGFGGSGKAFDWSLLPANAQQRAACPLVLSGGLSPANVGDGIAQLRPWAVDVSSGVEVSKGVKSAELMRQFVDAVRAADRQAG